MSATIIAVDFRRSEQSTVSLSQACRVLSDPGVRQSLTALNERTTELQRLAAVLKSQTEATVQILEETAQVMRNSKLKSLMTSLHGVAHDA